MTNYVVLYAAEGEKYSPLVGSFDGTSEASAVRAAAQQHNKSGSYVAIPARSFTPRIVKVEQTTKVSFG